MSVNSKMTAIADEIRELSGTTEAMGLNDMASTLVEANTEIDSQVELLAQAVAALEGKASGGSGGKNTITINISSPSTVVYYFNSLGFYSEINNGTIEALGGIVWHADPGGYDRTIRDTTYEIHAIGNCLIACLHSDGGTMDISKHSPSGGGSI